MSVSYNNRSEVNYAPNSDKDSPVAIGKPAAWHGTQHNGKIGRYTLDHPNDNYE